MSAPCSLKRSVSHDQIVRTTWINFLGEGYPHPYRRGIPPLLSERHNLQSVRHTMLGSHQFPSHLLLGNRHARGNNQRSVDVGRGGEVGREGGCDGMLHEGWVVRARALNVCNCINVIFYFPFVFCFVVSVLRSIIVTVFLVSLFVRGMKIANTCVFFLITGSETI